MSEDEDKSCSILDVNDLNFFNNQSHSVDNVMNNVSVIHAFRSGHLGLHKYFITHSHEILSYVFQPNNNKSTIQGFLLMSLEGNTSIIHSLLENCFFDKYVQNLLKDISNVPDYIIGRIATITLNCFVTAPKLSSQSISFIPSLLNFIDNSSVFSLFQTFFSENKEYALIHRWLYMSNFANYFPYELSKINFSKVLSVHDAYADSDVIKCSNLYQLIALGVRNSMLQNQFRSEEIILAFSENFPISLHFLEGYKWMALTDICCSTTADFLEEYVPMSLAIIYSPSTELRSYHVYCLRFLTQMIKFSKKAVKNIQSSQLLPVLTNLLLQFPDNTIFQWSFRKFFMESIKHPILGEKLVRTFVPLMINIILLGENRNLSSCFWLLLTKLSNESSNNSTIKGYLKIVPEFEDFQGHLKKYEELVTRCYGGVVPTPRVSLSQSF